MKLLEVFSYRTKTIYKFIYKSSNNGYFWYFRNNLSKSTTSVIDAAYKRVIRKDI